MMTLLSATACFLLQLITTAHGLSFDTHHDHESNVWNHHLVEEPFISLWNLSLKACIERCQIRKACRAVNYCRRRRSCQLLETDSGALASQNVTEEFNVFVRMIDVRLTPQLAQALSACNCTVNQTCLLNTSSCIITECRKLKVTNGVILGNMLNVGARVKVVCNDLYKLDNASQDQAVCRAGGQWLPAIACVPDTACGPPQSVTAATFVTFTNASNVIKAVYECDVGYDTPSALNEMSVECLSNSSWATIGFECLVDCGVPPSLPNGVVLAGYTVEKSVRNYTCNTGYAPNATSTLVTCLMYGNWTTVEFACIIDCGVPPPITNAEISAGGTSEGDTRTYTCSTGHVFYNLVTADITCQSDSTWSTAAFDCLWDCGPPPTISNAAAHVTDTVESSFVTYSCDAGYVANDTTATMCQAGATWTDVAFYCVVDCGPPDAITNTVISSAGGTTEGSVQSFACAANYAVQNLVTMETTCLANGTWSTPEFDCVPDCGEPAAITNADVSTGGTLEGDIRTYSCTAGHVLRNVVNVDITCQPGTSWSKASFDCLWDCGPAPNIANAWASTSETVENTVCDYTCTAGYAAIENTTSTCQAGSTWTPVAFSCAVDCKTPPIETSAFVQSGGTTEGSTMTYMCDPGYASNSSTMSITCQSSGTWTSAMFTCLKDCGPPTVLTNALVTGSGTLDGDTRTYSCDNGYVLRNVVTMDTTCQSNGSWSVPSFDCLWDRKTLAQIPFGTPSSGDTVTGSTRTYTCEYGYGTTGSATITCEDGTGWSEPYPNCTELMCDTDWHREGESCYYTSASGSERGFFAAQDLCHAYNAYLVQLETKAESDAVTSWYFGVSSEKAWIGMSDEAEEGTWVWMNSSVTTTWTNGTSVILTAAITVVLGQIENGTINIRAMLDGHCVKKVHTSYKPCRVGISSGIEALVPTSVMESITRNQKQWLPFQCR